MVCTSPAFLFRVELDMAKRYRDYKRVLITPKTAEKMVELLVDKTLQDHYKRCFSTTGAPFFDEEVGCHHMESGNLAVARLVESGIKISKKRAYLDIPDDPEVVKHLSDRLESFARRAKTAQSAFLRVAEVAHKWAHRSPLERLAEAGLELD